MKSLVLGSEKDGRARNPGFNRLKVRWRWRSGSSLAAIGPEPFWSTVRFLPRSVKISVMGVSTTGSAIVGFYYIFGT